jgi:hypothetical protein
VATFTAAEVDRDIPSFVDYWVARPGKDGVKLDWPATYRNHICHLATRLGKAPVSVCRASNGARM